MNKLVNSLAEDAKKYARECMAHTMHSDLFSAKVFQEKFAELLIEECRNVVAEVYGKYPLEQAVVFLTLDEEIAKHFYLEHCDEPQS